MDINMKNLNTSRLLPGVTKLSVFHIKRATKTLFVTMISNIARKEHTKNHKENYKKVK